MKLTDAEIARVFALVDEIEAVKSSLPPAPRGFDVSLQVAEALRTSLEQHVSALTELRDILSKLS